MLPEFEISPATLAYFVGVCVVTYLFYFLWTFAAPSKIAPGPPRKMFFGHIFEIMKNDERLHDYILENTEKYGNKTGVFQICIPGNPQEIVLASDEHVKFLMEKTESSVGIVSIGPFQQTVFKEVFGTGSIFMQNGKDWSFKRKQYSYLFSHKSIRDVMFPRFQMCSEKILAKLEKYAETGEKFDIQDLFSRATLDAISEIAFGQDLGCLDSEKTPSFMKSFDSAQQIPITRLRDPLWRLKRFFKLSYEKDLCDHMDIVNSKIYEMLDARDDGKYSKDHMSILDLIEQRAKKDGFNVDRKFLRDVVWDFMIAGRDTTACGASWMTYYLAQKPEILKNVREELKDKDLKDFRSVSLDLPYLNACALETLRLNPSVPNDSKWTSKAFKFPNGVEVPANTYINFNPYGIGRNKAVWGDDVLEFKPERFVEGDKAFGVGKYPAFNGGPRLCLGKPMALLEMKSLVSKIFEKFDLELCEEHLPITYIVTILLWIKGGLWVKAKKRAD